MKTADHAILQYKRNLLRNVIIIMFIAILVMGIVRIYEVNYLQAISDFILGAFLIYSYRKLKDIGEAAFYTLARVGFVFAFITLFILLIHSRENLIHYIWFSTNIYLIFYIFNKREAWLWFLSIISILTAMFFYDSALIGLKIKDLFIWIFNMFSIILIINWYEKMKVESSKRLLDVQYILANKVREKTLELQLLNESLEERIKNEVEKNREKDKQLLQQSRMAQMGEMISMIAHQWRQPLAAISATSASIKLKASKNKLDNDTLQKKAQDISNFSQHLSKTIDDFRDFFKPTKIKEKVTFSKIIEKSLKIIHTELKNKNILLETDYKCKGSINVYVNELQQVALNLIKNAEDALLEKEIKSPTITIRCYSNVHEAVLEVSDNAGGIPEEFIDKIFDPYFSTKSKKDGTGLGLYISKIIIEEHCGGKLSVTNGEDGAVFKVEVEVLS